MDNIIYNIVAIKRENGLITRVRLETGSDITQDDLEFLIEQGIEFNTLDADGNSAKVVVVMVDGVKHIRTARNDVVSDNLGNLPLYE